MTTIRLWQRMITPHMSSLAEALALRGHKVEYISENLISKERANMGWKRPTLKGVDLHFIHTPDEATSLAATALAGTVNITQGFRSNGLIAHAQNVFRQHQDNTHFIVMETVQDAGLVGVLKRGIYRWHLSRWGARPDGILAIGHKTSHWLKRLSAIEAPIHPFAYFLPEPDVVAPSVSEDFRFVFVGQIIDRKGIDELITSLVSLRDCNFRIDFIGNEPEGSSFRARAEKLLPLNVRFLGSKPIEEISAEMVEADCLILPSKHDGWGAVVSEAMLVGTPVVCSTSCGAAGIVNASGFGGTFKSMDTNDLSSSLRRQLEKGSVTPEARAVLANWSLCLGAQVGAEYLERIIASHSHSSTLSGAPWEDKFANPNFAKDK